MMIRCLLHVLAFVFGGHVCRSQEINCTTFESSSGTLYVVQGFTTHDCDYSWANSSNHVLANDNERAKEQVISSNRTSLHTYGCHETIEFSLDCMSEGHKMVKCHANCTGTTRLQVAENTSKLWLIPVVFGGLLVIAVILWFAIRKSLSRCKTTGYTHGNPNSDQNQGNNLEMVKRSDTSKESLLCKGPLHLGVCDGFVLTREHLFAPHES